MVVTIHIGPHWYRRLLHVLHVMTSHGHHGPMTQLWCRCQGHSGLSAPGESNEMVIPLEQRASDDSGCQRMAEGPTCKTRKNDCSDCSYDFLCTGFYRLKSISLSNSITVSIRLDRIKIQGHEVIPLYSTDK